LNILKNVHARSEQLVKGLLTMIEKHRLPICEVRGRGLMLGLDFDGPTGISGTFKDECFKRGLSLPTTGKFEAIRLIPPLIITESQCNDALAIMEEAGIATAAKHKTNSPVVKGFKEDGFLPGSKIPLRWYAEY
jgi:putrescine aminotransferase